MLLILLFLSCWTAFLLIDLDFILEKIRMKYTKSVIVKLVTAGLETATLEKLKKVLSRYPGRVPVYLKFLKTDGKGTVVSIGNTLSVEPHEGLVRDIEKIFGRDVVSFKT